ncbi:MAG: hypothetical protein ACQ5SW_09700 [Sphaerochaetaceae bacterium]
MKNKKRIGVIAILLVVGVTALSAAPAFVQGRNTQVGQQRIQAMDCLGDQEYFSNLPAEMQAEIETRRAVAAERQALGNYGQGAQRVALQNGCLAQNNRW